MRLYNRQIDLYCSLPCATIDSVVELLVREAQTSSAHATATTPDIEMGEMLALPTSHAALALAGDEYSECVLRATRYLIILLSLLQRLARTREIL